MWIISIDWKQITRKNRWSGFHLLLASSVWSWRRSNRLKLFQTSMPGANLWLISDAVAVALDIRLSSVSGNHYSFSLYSCLQTVILISPHLSYSQLMASYLLLTPLCSWLVLSRDPTPILCQSWRYHLERWRKVCHINAKPNNQQPHGIYSGRLPASLCRNTGGGGK